MPSENAHEALCITFAVSKYCILTRVDSRDPEPNVLALVNTTFGLPISDVQQTAATHVSERFVPMVGMSRELSSS